MSAWSKTLHGKDLTVERAFLPLQHAMIRLGYELTAVLAGKRLKFKRRTASTFAWDNHKREHNVTIAFKEKTRGIFAKESFLQVEVTFDDWDMTVSDGAAKAWQEIADKLQVMLSDPAVFMPLAPPGPIMPPVSGDPRHHLPVLPALRPVFGPGQQVLVSWSDGSWRAATVNQVSPSGSLYVQMHQTGHCHWVDQSAVRPL